MKKNKKYNNKKYNNKKNELEKMIIACSISTINKNFDLLIENYRLKTALTDIRDYLIDLPISENHLKDFRYIMDIIRDSIYEKED